MARLIITFGLVISTLCLMTGYIYLRAQPRALRRQELIMTEDIIGKEAPELVGGTWVNAAGHKLSDLRGKVVLLEFWTFGCWNCRNTIPYIIDWYKKYDG